MLTFRIRWLLAPALLALGLAVPGAPAQAAAAATVATADVCPAVGGQVGCAVLLGKPGPAMAPDATTTPAGLNPSNLHAAYALQSAADGSRQTVAVVNPFDDPNAEADLAAYRTQWGIPACTTADGCFSKVDENGGTSYPGASTLYSVAAAQALDMISAICPNCHILLVEATTGGLSDVGLAENTAVSLGAKFIDNTWVTPESTFGSAAAEASFDASYLNHPGVAITAPTGNSGYGNIGYPAASQYVTAAGGTTLTYNDSGLRHWIETAWSGTASGCSAYEPKPSWQTDTGCSGRTVSDVAAVADPGTPVAMYDSFGEPGWMTGGGTSVASAIIAAVYALAGTPASGSYPASYPYKSGTLLNSITSGSTGTCTPSYLCTAGPGYNGPAGMGSPENIIPFTPAGTRTGNLYSGIKDKCLDDYGDGTADLTKVDLYTCNETVAQEWTLESDGTIRVLGGCLAVHLDGTATGTVVERDTCDGSAAQQWRSFANGMLTNPRSGLCLTDPGATTTNGTQLQINTCVGGAADQVWALPYPVPSSSGLIKAGVSSSLCVDDRGDSTVNQNPVQIYTCNASVAQQWTIEPDGSLHVLGGCMDLTAGNSTNGTKVQFYGCLGNDNQQWRVLSDGSLMNPETGKCLDDPGGTTTSGTQLDIYTCNGANGQRWILP